MTWAQRLDLPPHRIRDRIAEHIEEGGLEKGVEQGDSLAALGPQGARRKLFYCGTVISCDERVHIVRSRGDKLLLALCWDLHDLCTDGVQRFALYCVL